MDLHQDSAGNFYSEVPPNIRVTYVCRSDREADKDWAKGDTIRIQTYSGDGSAKLYPGPELPIASEETLGKLVAALTRVYLAGQRGTSTTGPHSP